MGDNKAFTLVEILFTIALMVIVFSIAIPYFKDLREVSERKTAAFTLGSALSYARNEAITRALPVSVCKSSNIDLLDDPSEDPPVPFCDTSDDNGWETGFIVFLDRNNNGRRDTDEPLLRVFGLNLSPLTIIRGSNIPENRVTYTALGRTSEDMSGLIQFARPGQGGDLFDLDASRYFTMEVAANGRYLIRGPL